jgi:hypothetical protein
MDVEYDFIFQVVGRDSFWNIVEHGSKLLTLEFLCTLQITDYESNLDFSGKNIRLSRRI